MDGRRVLLNYVLKEAEAVVELLHRRVKGTNAAVVDGPGAP
jgi:hypothetical protein